MDEKDPEALKVSVLVLHIELMTVVQKVRGESSRSAPYDSTVNIIASLA